MSAAAQTNVVMVGDTARSADLRHVVPVFIRDPFLYVEHGGERHAFVHDYDMPLLSEVSGLSVDSLESLGLAEVLASGSSAHDGLLEVAARACHLLAVHEAVVPGDFPFEAGDFLRAQRIEVRVDRPFFEQRRRRKLEWQLDGMLHAQRAAEAAMETIRQGLRDRPGVSVEELRSMAMRSLAENGMTFDVMTISHGTQSAVVHHRGSGVIEQGEPVLVDIFPRDQRSGCWADITRTFCVGKAPEELRAYHAACLEARGAALPAIRPGADGAEPHRLAEAVFEQRGYGLGPAASAEDEKVGRFVHGLGHGVGLELHEPPSLSSGGQRLAEGDVVTVEPGLYRRDFGGCRIEDMVLVSENGYTLLTDFDYELEV